MTDWLTPDRFAALIVLSFGLGCLIPLLGPQSKKSLITWLSLCSSFIGGVLVFSAAISNWIKPMSQELVLVHGFFLAGLPEISMSVYVDHLAAFFLLIAGGSIILVSLYSVGWLRTVSERHIIAGVFNLFALCTVGTVVLNNIYFYLFSLEAMTLSFSYLMLYRHNRLLEKPGSNLDEINTAKTAFKSYLIFSHIAVMLITAGLLTLAVDAGSFNFDDLRVLTADRIAHPTVIFLLTLLGFGIKAGMMPTHVWVSMVHPQSPTNIHAMMSGIILKVAGIYGMIRVFFDFLGPCIPWWWGWLVLLLASSTALIGVFYALLGHDLKTTLASHSVENIGIILVGIGMALIYSSPEFSSTKSFANLANLALVASLYHTLNHAVFKSLLFFATGAVEDRTGTVRFRDLDGLMRYYPWTSNAFLVGAISISGFPPFNGFVSEWLTLQSIFSGINIFATPLRLPLLIGLLSALFLLSSAFGLTALAFVKILGEVFLGPPRNKEIMKSAQKGDVPWSMRSVLVFLSALCLLLGIIPSFMTRQLGSISSSVIPIENQEPSVTTDFGDGVKLKVLAENENGIQNQGQPVYGAQLSDRILIFFGTVMLLPIGLSIIAMRARKRGQRTATGPIWTGGTAYDPESMEFTGSALTSLVWGVFGRRDRTTTEQQNPLPSYRIWLTRSFYVPEIFRQGYDWIVDHLLKVSQAIGDEFQNGDIRRYLWYIFVAFGFVLAALFWLALGNGG